MANTIASVLRKTGGKAPGVAQIRVLLVFAWVAFQSVRLTEGYGGAVLSPLWIVPHAVVPALFAVLGFCLSQAAVGRPARDFLLDRVRGAGPVLLVAVMAAALVIGPVVTTGGLRAYVTDPLFARYFLNLAGWPQFSLPGVFEFNNYPEVVNEALWLTPCFMIAAVYALATVRSRFPIRFGLAGSTVTLVVYAVGVAVDLIPSLAGSVIRYSFVGSGLAAILAGQCGTLAFVLRDRLAIAWPLQVAPFLALGGLSFVVGPDLIDLPGAPVLIALLGALAGLSGAFRILPGASLARFALPILHGTMLLSFPLQQFAADRGPTDQAALTNLGLSLPAAVALAWAVHRIALRMGLAEMRTAADFEGDIHVPQSRRPRSWKAIARQSAEGLGIAVVVAAVGLVVILLTVMALQSDPVGV